MPPRYAYWTILVDEQPTAFRAALQDDLMPTFKRLRQKHPSARLVWFQNGKIWNSRLDAREAMHERGERGRAGDERQGGFKSRRVPRTSGHQAPRPSRPQDPRTSRPQDPRTSGHQAARPSRPQDPRTSLRDPAGKLEWSPKGKPQERPHEKPKGKLAWSPRGETTKARPAEKRDKRWRPGGEHRDPRQKYKDAKKAKWTRFKQTIRKRWEKKQGPKKDDE